MENSKQYFGFSFLNVEKIPVKFIHYIWRVFWTDVTEAVVEAPAGKIHHGLENIWNILQAFPYD